METFKQVGLKAQDTPNEKADSAPQKTYEDMF